MNNSRFGNNFGGGNFKKKNFGGGGYNSDKPMFKTVCAQCGKNCEVPFKPNGNKPVLCNECFRGSDSRNENRSDFRPARHDRPDFHKHDDYKNKPQAPNPNQYKKDFEILNAKLDKIIGMMMPGTPKRPEPTQEVTVGPLAMEEIIIPEVASTTEVKTEKKAPKKKATPKKKAKEETIN
jgi:CxxC-x17-CxxC domain-containing protein